MRKQLPRDVEAKIYFLTSEEGGRQSAVFSDCRGQFQHLDDGHTWDAVYEFPEGDQGELGKTTRAYIAFLSPSMHVHKLIVGSKFDVCEGGKLVARGEIIDILDLEASAKKDREWRRKNGWPLEYPEAL